MRTSWFAASLLEPTTQPRNPARHRALGNNAARLRLATSAASQMIDELVK